MSRTPYVEVGGAHEHESGLCSRPSPIFASWPLVTVGACCFVFSSVLILDLQISDNLDRRDAGIVFGFYPQILLFGEMIPPRVPSLT